MGRRLLATGLAVCLMLVAVAASAQDMVPLGASTMAPGQGHAADNTPPPPSGGVPAGHPEMPAAGNNDLSTVPPLPDVSVRVGDDGKVRTCTCPSGGPHLPGCKKTILKVENLHGMVKVSARQGNRSATVEGPAKSLNAALVRSQLEKAGIRIDRVSRANQALRAEFGSLSKRVGRAEKRLSKLEEASDTQRAVNRSQNEVLYGRNGSGGLIKAVSDLKATIDQELDAFGRTITGFGGRLTKLEGTVGFLTNNAMVLWVVVIILGIGVLRAHGAIRKLRPAAPEEGEE